MKINSYDVKHAHDHYEKVYSKSLLPPPVSPLLLLSKLFVPFNFVNIRCKRRPGRTL
jgi:hypothetical protein